MSPTSKAERLRSRLSINPDEPAPVAVSPSPAPPAPSATETEAAPPESPSTARLSTAPKRSRRPRAGAPAAVTAVEDPSITPGRKDYRSFYIEDATFARFRAAIYWLARREDAADVVPENMSVAVESWMADTATELERRFNNGDIFRMPPPSKRRRPAR